MINPVIFNLAANKRLFLPISWNDGSNVYDKKSKELVYYKKHFKKSCEWLRCPSNIHAAFEAGDCKYEEENPIASKPQYIHPRVTAQRGAFTVHGKDKRNLFDILKNKKLDNMEYSEIFLYGKHDFNYDLFQRNQGDCFNNVYLKKYKINPCKKVLKEMLDDLKMIGITYSTLFPELTGLANELNATNIDI